MPRPLPLLVACIAVTAWLATAAPLPAQPSTPAGGAAAPHSERILDDAAVYLARVASDHGMLLIGEIHGARAAPALTADIAARLANQQAVVVAFEWPETEQLAVDRYLASDGSAADIAQLAASTFWHDPQPDGRTSRAMLAALERLRVLRRGGADVRVVCFDWDWSGDTSGDRDAALAARLRAARQRHAGAAMIVLTGNYHARLARGAPWNPEQAFAGWLLRDLQPFNVDVRALAGDAWICMAGAACGIHPLGLPPGAEAGLVVHAAPNAQGYRATLTLPTDAASEPVVSNARGRAATGL